MGRPVGWVIGKENRYETGTLFHRRLLVLPGVLFFAVGLWRHEQIYSHLCQTRRAHLAETM